MIVPDYFVAIAFWEWAGTAQKGDSEFQFIQNLLTFIGKSRNPATPYALSWQAMPRLRPSAPYYLSGSHFPNLLVCARTPWGGEPC